MSVHKVSLAASAKTMSYKVAAVQMASGTKVDGNLNEARRHIEKAAQQGAKLVVLPEFFAIMGKNEQDKINVSEQDGAGTIQSFLSEMAKLHKIWLVGGSMPLVSSSPDKVRNRCLVYN